MRRREWWQSYSIENVTAVRGARGPKSQNLWMSTKSHGWTHESRTKWIVVCIFIITYKWYLCWIVVFIENGFHSFSHTDFLWPLTSIDCVCIVYACSNRAALLMNERDETQIWFDLWHVTHLHLSTNTLTPICFGCVDSISPNDEKNILSRIKSIKKFMQCRQEWVMHLHIYVHRIYI